MFKRLIQSTIERSGFFLRPLRTVPRGVDPFIDLTRYRGAPTLPVIGSVGGNLAHRSASLPNVPPAR